MLQKHFLAKITFDYIQREIPGQTPPVQHGGTGGQGGVETFFGGGYT